MKSTGKQICSRCGDKGWVWGVNANFQHQVIDCPACESKQEDVSALKALFLCACGCGRSLSAGRMKFASLVCAWRSRRQRNAIGLVTCFMLLIAGCSTQPIAKTISKAELQSMTPPETHRVARTAVAPDFVVLPPQKVIKLAWDYIEMPTQYTNSASENPHVIGDRFIVMTDTGPVIESSQDLVHWQDATNSVGTAAQFTMGKQSESFRFKTWPIHP